MVIKINRYSIIPYSLVKHGIRAVVKCVSVAITTK